MPLTLATGAELARNEVFQYRVAMAFYFVARNVLSEDAGTPGNELRVNFARSIALQDHTHFMQYAAMVATDKPIVDAGPYSNPVTGPSDTAIIAAVTNMWNRLADVRT